MGISLSAQTVYFLCSLVLGLILGVLYDLLRLTRMTLNAGNVFVTVSDVLFFAVSGVLTSLFALPFNKGDVRGFILFGEAAGFLAYRLTLGSVMGKVYAFSARLIRSFVQKILKFLEKFFNYLLKLLCRLVYNINEVIEQLLRNPLKQKRAARQKARSRHKERKYEKKKHQKAKYRRAAKRR